MNRIMSCFEFHAYNDYILYWFLNLQGIRQSIENKNDYNKLRYEYKNKTSLKIQVSEFKKSNLKVILK